MARARSIKPGFFTNEELAEVDPLGRILFAGLWTLADRAGRLEDRPKRIKAGVLPYDECDIESLLNALARRRFILRYEAGGRRLIQITEFAKHQSPHVREPASTLPEPSEHSSSTVQSQCEALPKPEPAALTADSPLLTADSREKAIARKRASLPSVDPPDGVQAETWAAWLRHKGRKQTADADRMQRRRLAEWAAAGHDVNAIVETAVAGGWKGLREPDRPRPSGQGPPRQTLRERAIANMDEITGVSNAGRSTINGTAHRVGAAPVPPLPPRLWVEGGANVDRDDAG